MAGMASEAMLETQRRQSEVFDFDNPNSADNEDHQSVSLLAAKIEIDITKTSGSENDDADNNNKFVFISDLMDDLRRCETSNSATSSRSTHSTPMRSQSNVMSGASSALPDSDSTFEKSKERAHAIGKLSQCHIICSY